MAFGRIFGRISTHEDADIVCRLDRQFVMLIGDSETPVKLCLAMFSALYTMQLTASIQRRFVNSSFESFQSKNLSQKGLTKKTFKSALCVFLTFESRI